MSSVRRRTNGPSGRSVRQRRNGNGNASNANLMAGLNQYGSFIPNTTRWNNNENWKKSGPPRRLNVKVFTLPKAMNNENNVNYNKYVNGGIYYHVRRPGAHPGLYAAKTLYKLISIFGGHGSRLTTINNLNHFLTHSKLNTVLFTNVKTRRPVRPKNIKKVRVRMHGSGLSMRNATHAAAVIKHAYRARRAVARR